MELIKNFTIGSDFELFVKDTLSNEIINAKKYIKGSKEKPYNFDKRSPFWATSLDNISMEGNIPPCSTAEEFNSNICHVIDYMNSLLPHHLCTVHEPAAFISKKYLKTKEARTFGCEPSLNAYSKMINDFLFDASELNLRTCCTHVHIKYEGMNFDLSAELVKSMDLHLGIPSIIIEPENPRRMLYGKLGEMRFTEDKTTEYRVLSSFFSSTEKLRKWVFNNTVKSIEWINKGNRVSEDLAADFEKAMKENNKELAETIIKNYQIELPQ